MAVIGVWFAVCANVQAAEIYDADGTLALTGEYDTGFAYTVTNLTLNRTINCDMITGFALRDIVGQLITDLKTVNILS